MNTSPAIGRTYCLIDGCDSIVRRSNTTGICRSVHWRESNRAKYEAKFNVTVVDLGERECLKPGCDTVVSTFTKNGLCRPHRHLAYTVHGLGGYAGMTRKFGNPANRRRVLVTDLAMNDYTREQIWEADNGICHLCDKPAGDNWVIEHVIPLCMLGPDGFDNVAVSCHSCNARKSGFWAGSSDAEILARALDLFFSIWDEPFDGPVRLIQL